MKSRRARSLFTQTWNTHYIAADRQDDGIRDSECPAKSVSAIPIAIQTTVGEPSEQEVFRAAVRGRRRSCPLLTTRFNSGGDIEEIQVPIGLSNLAGHVDCAAYGNVSTSNNPTKTNGHKTSDCENYANREDSTA